MRKMNLKIVILTGVLVGAMLLLGTTTSQAVLQANATTHNSPVSKVGSEWMTQIRQMETSGQTMGLNETLSGLNATSESNHIDVHMMLPTEYGAIAILSASGYGNPGKLRDETNAQKRTTTGNPTGVYFTGDRLEYLASKEGDGTTIGKYNFQSGTTGNLGTIGDMNKFLWHDGTYNRQSGKNTYPRQGNYAWAAGENGIFSWWGHILVEVYGSSTGANKKALLGRGVCVPEI